MTAAPDVLTVSAPEARTLSADASQPIPEACACITPLQRLALRIEEWLDRREADEGADQCHTSN